MVQKFKDAANILKAKLKKDDLQENLIQVTSEQNWQAPTNILHEIANASYNYQKCQQIIEFIWDKLKKKNSWRKILKTLNLVDFLLKNGPPNLVSSFKYEIYTLKSFYDFSHYSDNIDRGQAIRQRAKGIVQLLQNEQILQEERNKAKTIRDRMSGITGGYSYGDQGGSGKYQSYDNKSYDKNDSSSGYGNSKLNTTYGDYNYNQSTLAKYKDKEASKDAKLNTSVTQPSKKVAEQEKKDITGQTQPVENKKPFEQQVKRLQKPGQKPIPQSEKPTMNIAGNAGNSDNTKPQVTQPQKQQATGGSLLDDDILGFSQPTSVTNPVPTPLANTNNNQSTNSAQQTQQVQQQFINPIYGTTAPLAAQNIQQQQQNVGNLNFINPMYGTTAPLAAQQQPNLNNLNFVNPMYGTTAPMAAQNIQPNAQMNFINPMYGTTAPMAAQNYQFQQGYQQPSINLNIPQSPYINPMYPTTAPMAAQQINMNQGISLSSQPKKNDQEDFGGFQSGNTSNQNVKWLSQKEKGLIDFSDFGSELKKVQTPQANTQGKTINTGWDW